MEGAENDAPTCEERAHYAERRHMFWRERCLDHARTIDKQNKLICQLRESTKEVEAIGEAFDAATTALQNVVDNVCRRMIESGGVVEGVDFNALQVGLSSVISEAQSIKDKTND